MHARDALSRVALAELPFENPTPQGGHDFRHNDPVGGARQRIAALLAPSALHKSGTPQNGKKLCRVGNGNTFRFANLGNGEPLPRFLPGDLQQAAQSVFFVRTDFHERNLDVGITSREGKSNPSAKRATSDIFSRSQGGSQTNSSFTSVTPGIALSFVSTCLGR